MGTLDIILLICFVPALIQGLTKGLIQQLAGLVALFLGVWAAVRFGGQAATWLEGFVKLDPKVMQIAGFAVVAIVTIVLLSLLGRVLAKALDMAALGWADRLLGLVFALFKTALLLGLAALVFDSLNKTLTLTDPKTLEDSLLYPQLRELALRVFPYLKELVSQINV